MTAVSPYAPSNLILGDLNDLGHVLIEYSRGAGGFPKRIVIQAFQMRVVRSFAGSPAEWREIKIKGKAGNGRGTVADVFVKKCERTASAKTSLLH